MDPGTKNLTKEDSEYILQMLSFYPNLKMATGFGIEENKQEAE